MLDLMGDNWDSSILKKLFISTGTNKVYTGEMKCVANITVHQGGISLTFTFFI